MSDARPVPLLTVFTPTYNRVRELARLYRSLLAQDDMRFEWLIVDDGSVDGTEGVVSAWASEEGPFKIRYLRQNNSGKHVAHNLGAREAAGGLFMCVDSDDWLAPNAVRTVLSLTLREHDAGIVFPRLLFEEEQPREMPWFPKGVDRIELSDMRMKYGLVIETAIVFRTDGLRRHPFPVVEGENYMPEGSAYYGFRSPELFVVNPCAFYECAYLDGGLTRNIYRNWLENPKGTKMALAARYEAAKRYPGLRGLRERIAAIVGSESLNMALGRPLAEGLACGQAITLALAPLAAVVCKKRYKGLI